MAEEVHDGKFKIRCVGRILLTHIVEFWINSNHPRKWPACHLGELNKNICSVWKGNQKQMKRYHEQRQGWGPTEPALAKTAQDVQEMGTCSHSAAQFRGWAGRSPGGEENTEYLWHPFPFSAPSPLQKAFLWLQSSCSLAFCCWEEAEFIKQAHRDAVI